MAGSGAAEVAAQRVRAVQHDGVARLRLAAEFYCAGHGRYRRAELSFLTWEIGRGVLHPASGSPWWRAVNDRLLRDKVEAALLAEGAPGAASAHSVELWAEFVERPSGPAWYRAHNASVLSGYLDHESLAGEELLAERFMINVALVRVLYTHVMVARPRLALGTFAPLGRLLADPRRRTVGLFMDLGRSFPDRYPLTGITVEDLLVAEGRLPRALDYGIIAPRLAELYEFAAASLELPRIADLVEDGAPCYALPVSWHWVWSVNRGIGALTRLASFAVSREGIARSGNGVRE